MALAGFSVMHLQEQQSKPVSETLTRVFPCGYYGPDTDQERH